MRYTSGHKEITRERILRAASEGFRKKGADGVAISDLMEELQLTHGGFYRHFKNKEQLFVEALKKAIGDGEHFLKSATENSPKGKELHGIIATYLSLEHCADVQHGCPVAALATEVARQPKAVRSAFDQAIAAFISLVAPYVPGKSIKERESKARILFSGMVGIISMARAISDVAAREELLKSSRDMYIQAFCSP
jgi:TetR/AcrR family transcriptional repressor of nem operon